MPADLLKRAQWKAEKAAARAEAQARKAIAKEDVAKAKKSADVQAPPKNKNNSYHSARGGGNKTSSRKSDNFDEVAGCGFRWHCC